MKEKNHWIIALSLPLIVLGVLFLSSQAHSAQFEEIEKRSHALFQYDELHPHKLPAHKLRALSLAIEFGNKSGAETLINDLEARRKQLKT